MPTMSRPRLKDSEQMTIEEFLAFTEERPDGERWELIEGIAILNASPTDYHQTITGNIHGLLWLHQRQQNVTWIPLLGVGTRVPVSPRSLPQPDLMVKGAALTGTPISDEALVLFEILSKSNTKSDQAWRKRVYASIPNCQHYVTVAQGTPLVTRFDRASNWDKTEHTRIIDALALPALGVSLPLAEIYRGTPVATPRETQGS